MVVANAVAALSEIGRDDFLNKGVVNKLLTALNECTEWGQIFILDAVAEYIPSDNREAQVRTICKIRSKNYSKITLSRILVPVFVVTVVFSAVVVAVEPKNVRKIEFKNDRG